MAATVLTQSLTHYNPKLPILMAGDASQYGIGAGIMHLMPNGSKQHYNFCVMYFIWNREAIYLSGESGSLINLWHKKFHQFLFNRRFTLVTYQKSLTTILGPKKGVPLLVAVRMQRWAHLLSDYSYDICFTPTLVHENADRLSRLPLPSFCSVGNYKDTAVLDI